jgi:multidrug efflux pump subunit AcrA (membrane-fusion protein)
MTDRTGASWIVYVLGALCAGAIVAAILLVGPASSSQATITRTATVAQGVVQSTVSGSGNLQAASQLNLGFKTSGTVTHIYVTQGQQVVQGQLLATLDPQSAEVTLEQAKATLQSAEASLAKEEETDGEGSSSGGSSGASAPASASAASVSDQDGSAQAVDAAYSGQPPGASTTPGVTTTPPTGTPTTTTTTPSATTTPAATTPAATTPSTRTTPAARNAPSTRTAPSVTSTSKATQTEATQSEKAATKEKETVSTATREANLASARAAVRSASLTVQSDEQAVQNTKLYAPQSGTVVSLSGQVGEVVSASGTTKASSASSSSGASSTGATGASAASRTGADASSSSGSGASTGSGSSSFAVLSDLSSMQLVVALSESEIGKVKAGQIATVTVEALEGRKLAAHVSEVALTPTSSSGAVSYDVTFQLDQMESELKVGMSATAEVVVQQAQGLSVPSSAISAASVTVERGGKQVRQPVVTGLVGDTSTIVSSGLKAGETVVLPSVSTTSSVTSGLTSKLGSRLGGAGLGGGAFPGGGAAFFRGGG